MHNGVAQNPAGHPVSPVFSMLWKHGICSQKEGDKTVFEAPKDQECNVSWKEQIFSHWSHQKTGFWLRSMVQDVSGVSHLGCVRGGDLIPRKRLWALSSYKTFKTVILLSLLLNYVMGLHMRSLVFWETLDLYLVDSPWIPWIFQRKHMSGKQKIISGSVADTWSSQ